MEVVVSTEHRRFKFPNAEFEVLQEGMVIIRQPEKGIVAAFACGKWDNVQSIEFKDDGK